MEFECELAVARACAAACEELSFFADAGDVVATLLRMAGESGGRVWRLALLCCCGERARDLLRCAWLLGHEPWALAREEMGWAAACERVLNELAPCENAARGFAVLARLVSDGEQAQALFEQKCDLTDAATLAHYAVLLATRGDVRGALAALERLPERSQLFFVARGQVHAAAGNLEAALDAWDKCTASAAVLVAQSGAWRSKGLGRRALELAERAWNLRHELGEEAALRLQCHIAVMRAEVCGETREAERVLHSVVTSNFRDDDAWFDLAAVQSEAGAWEEAEASIEQCLELRRAQRGEAEGEERSAPLLAALNQRALILCGLGRRVEAAALWQRLADLHELRSDWQSAVAVLFNLGQLAEETGDLEAAEAGYGRCCLVEETRLADSNTVGRIETCHRRATVLAALGRDEVARVLRATCAEVARRLVGSDHRAFAELSAQI